MGNFSFFEECRVVECLVESDQWRALAIAVEADDRIGPNQNGAKSMNPFSDVPNDQKRFK